MGMTDLEQFIVKAKANGWVGVLKGGKKIEASRKGSYDITYDEGDFHYHDSFVGFSDFCGQEHVTYKNDPVWSKDGDFEYRDMNLGDYQRFNGVEKILRQGTLVYELIYCGGVVRK